MDNKRLVKLLTGMHSSSYAFETLYNEYSNFIYGIVLSVLHDTNNSNDIVQEIFIKLYKMDADKLPRDNAMGWLYRVAKNEALGFLRSQRLMHNIDELSEKMENNNFEEHVIENMTFKDIISILEDDYKEIVILKIVAGLKHKDIAKILNLSEGTVRWKYKKALDTLRKSTRN